MFSWASAHCGSTCETAGWPRRDLVRLRRTSSYGDSDMVPHVKEGFFSRSDGLKRGVCASDELETRMRAAYDRVGWGNEGVVDGTCPWDAPDGGFVLQNFERAGESQDRGQPIRVKCGVTVARSDWSGQSRVPWRRCPRGAVRGPVTRRGRRRAFGVCKGVVVWWWRNWLCEMSHSWPRGTSWGEET